MKNDDDDVGILSSLSGSLFLFINSTIRKSDVQFS